MTIGSTLGATVPFTTGHSKYNALIDVGTTRSCMSEVYYKSLMLPKINHLFFVMVRSASGNNLQLR